MWHTSLLIQQGVYQLDATNKQHKRTQCYLFLTAQILSVFDKNII
jgi:hypothetical protein